jgi:hypothetical protein
VDCLFSRSNALWVVKTPPKGEHLRPDFLRRLWGEFDQVSRHDEIMSQKNLTFLWSEYFSVQTRKMFEAVVEQASVIRKVRKPSTYLANYPLLCWRGSLAPTRLLAAASQTSTLIR